MIFIRTKYDNMLTRVLFILVELIFQTKVEGGLELSCLKEFSRARDLVPSGTKVSICTILVL